MHNFFLKVKQNPLIFLISKLWEYSAGNKKNVIIYVTLSLLSNIAHLAGPLIGAAILSTLQTKGINRETFWTAIGLCSLFIILQIIVWAFHGPSRVLERTNGFLVRANYKRHLLRGVMDLPTEWHTDHHSGDTIDKIEKGSDALYDFAAETGFQIISSVVGLVGSYVALIYFNIHAAYIVLAMLIATGAIIIKFDKKLVVQYKELNRADNRISEKVYDAISNITTVIILRIERLILGTVTKQLFAPLELYRDNTKRNELKWFLVSLCTALMMFFILVSYISQVVFSGGIILAGTLFALYGYVDRINGVFYDFAWQYSSIVRRRAAVANAEEISNEFRKRSQGPSLPLKNWQELSIEDLRFAYNNHAGREAHIDGISLTIKRGERIAIIGESGSGKSTFLKLVRDLYHPQNVRVLLDGKLLPNGFKSIREEISLIPQEPEIFATTILENITVGVPYEMPYVKHYTDMACFTEVAERLPKQFDSSIVEKGVNLSGGEKQRLALSRGLLASEDKEIVLLDEPTSSVDSRNELKIYKNIFQEFKGKTIISSIHRLHLLQYFDCIYMFRNGSIIASGNLEDLLVESPEFKNLWDKYHKRHT